MLPNRQSYPPVRRVYPYAILFGIMKLLYFWSSDPSRKPVPRERNHGIEAVPALLTQVRARGADVEYIDTANLTEKARIENYARAVLPAVYKHYEIKRILGSNRRSGCFFGAEVPALLATEGNSVGDTYPHRIGERIMTIHGFLTGLLVADQPSTKSREPAS